MTTRYLGTYVDPFVAFDRGAVLPWRGTSVAQSISGNPNHKTNLEGIRYLKVGRVEVTARFH